MEDLENHEELISTNHDFVHKWEVDPPPLCLNVAIGKQQPEKRNVVNYPERWY